MFRVSNNWDDKEFVLSQVQKDGMSLKNASPRLKKDPDVVLEALIQTQNSIMFVDPILLNQSSFFKKVFQSYRFQRNSTLTSMGTIFSEATEKLRNNKDFILSLLKEVKGWMFVFPYLGSELKINLDFWKEVLSSDSIPTDILTKTFKDSPLFNNEELTIHFLNECIKRRIYPKPHEISPNLNENKKIIKLYFRIDLDSALSYMNKKLWQSNPKNDSFIYDFWRDTNYSNQIIEHDNFNNSMLPSLKQRYELDNGKVWVPPNTETDDEDYENEDEDYENENNYEEDDWGDWSDTESYTNQSKDTLVETKKTDFSYLFKNNISKLALSQYKGKKSSVISLFKLYSYIVDIRSNDIEEANLFRGKSLPLWKAILKEQVKQFTPDEKIITNITQSLQVIDAYFKNNKQPLDSPSLKQEKVTLYKASRYKNLIVNLVGYLISFFGHIGIKVKPLQIVSDVSNIKVIGLKADASGESPAVSQLLSQVSIVKDKLTEMLLNEFRFSSIEELASKLPKNKTKGIEYYTTRGLYVSLDTLKSYTFLEDLLADVKKEKIIDKNYSRLQVSQGKVILPSKNKVVKTINYLNPQELETKISEYENKINEYNSKLKSYEKKLSNEPKTIQLGDHQVKIVKVLYKNISRLVVVEGPYQGHYVDELVSSTGEVIGSVSKASPTLIETSKTLKSISTADIQYVFTEPIEFSNLQKISDYEPPKNWKEILDYDYIRGLEYIDNLVDIPRNLFHNIVGNNILYNIGNESQKMGSNLTTSNTYDGVVVNHETKGPDLEIDRGLEFEGGRPSVIENKLFTTSSCFPEGLGTRIFTQQVKSGSEAGFKSINTYAAKGGDYMGYYIWPKVGYNAFVTIYRHDTNTRGLETLYNYLEAWLRKNKTSAEIFDSHINVYISDIYACKAGNRFIGQELWKKIGGGVPMKFDLRSGSLSMRILEAYVTLKAEKEGLDPKDYLNIDYSKFANYSLECLLDKYYASTVKIPTAELLRRVKDSVKNYENGELFRIYQNPKTRPKLLNYLNTIKSNKPKLVEDVLLILNQKGYQNIKLASDVKISEDPMIREIDESIVNQVWNGINKLYESGNFK